MNKSTKSQRAVGDNINGHRHCIACGTHNILSMQLVFHPLSDGCVEALFRSHRVLQGYAGILHGGIISILLDSAMTHCLFHHKVKAVTADLQVRFLASVPCGVEVNLLAWITSSRRALYCLRSELRVGGRLMAHADAKFMKKREL